MKKIVLIVFSIFIYFNLNLVAFAATKVQVVNTKDFETAIKNIKNEFILEDWFQENTDYPTLNDWVEMIKTKNQLLPSFQSMLDIDVVKNALNAPDTSFLMPSTQNGNNDAINVEKFLGQEKYSDDVLAQKFINYINNLFPPPTLFSLQNLSHDKTNLIIPYSPNPPAMTSMINFREHDTNLDKIQQTLNKDSSYQSYMADYRSRMAARTLFLSNIMRAYGKRKVYQGSDKSIAEMEKKEIDTRLQESYFNKIKDASPTTIQRETLFVLAKISQQLYEIQQNQERMLILQSLNGLNNLKSFPLSMTSYNFGKMVYCSLPKNKTEAACQQSMGSMLNGGGVYGF